MGGRVEIASLAVVVDVASLAETLKTTGATAMQATPASWRLLLESGWQADPVLKILCGGEVLPRAPRSDTRAEERSSLEPLWSD